MSSEADLRRCLFHAVLSGFKNRTENTNQFILSKASILAFLFSSRSQII